MADPLRLIDPAQRDASRRAAFETQRVPEELGSHRLAAQHYQPSEALVTAANAAIAVGAPLLITGEPGTGKTQVAHWLAWYLDIQDRLFPLYVKSTTTAEDLLYRFDAVAYFHAAHDPERRGTGEKLDKTRFIEHGPLWKALTSSRSIVLIDEIDKAPRDFPNDLLHVLDQHEFFVPEAQAWVRRDPKHPPPFVVITSNSERRLPEPFLRRCIFHHIDFDIDLLRKAIAARAGNFPRLGEAAREAALKRFLEIRARPLRKQPATAELLVWLTLLGARGVDARALLDVSLRDLPALAALIKDRDDLNQL